MKSTKYDNPEALLIAIKAKNKLLYKLATIIAIIVCLLICIIHTLNNWIFLQAIIICICVIFLTLFITALYTSINTNYYKLRIVSKMLTRFELGMIYKEKIEDYTIIDDFLRISKKNKVKIEDYIEWEKDGKTISMMNVYIDKKIDGSSLYTGVVVKYPLEKDMFAVIRKKTENIIRVYSSKLKLYEGDNDFKKYYDISSLNPLSEVFIEKISVFAKKNNDCFNFMIKDNFVYISMNNAKTLLNIMDNTSIKIMEDDIKYMLDVINNLIEIIKLG